MKKIKAILSLMIAMVILCISIMPAFASGNAKEKLEELQDKVFNVATEFNIEVEGIYYPIEGECFLEYTNETYNNLRNVLNDAGSFINENSMDIYLGNIESIDEIEEHMVAIDKAYAEMVLKKSELEFLVNYCEFETNIGYYGDDVWNEFTDKLECAKVILADENIMDTRVTNAFWALFETYNQLCLYNNKFGDVDGDGILTVMDATLIQLYLAKHTELNSSQKYVAWVCTTYSGEIDITCVTEIQRNLAHLTDDTNWCYNYKVLLESTNLRDIKSNQLFYNAFSKC